MDTSGGWAADEPRWPAGLQGFFLLFFNSYFLKQKITKKKRRRKEVLGKKLDTRIIFPDSQKCACFEKIEKAMIERFKSKLI